jgi:hypothetical protein
MGKSMVSSRFSFISYPLTMAIEIFSNGEVLMPEAMERSRRGSDEMLGMRSLWAGEFAR